MDQKVALEKLEGLGTPKAIADYFKEEGIVGYTLNGSACPVTNWCYREHVAPKGMLIHTSYGEQTLYRDKKQLGEDPDKEVTTYLPEVVGDFISQFDQGMYPDLIQER